MGRDDMANRFPPRADGAALGAMQHFVEGIAQQPGAFMLGEPDVKCLRQAVGRFADAYRAASNRATRSTTDVVLKDQMRASAEALIRGYANRIRVNAGIRDELKIAVGVNPDNPTRSKRFVQPTSPVLTVVAATNGAHTLRYADSLAPNRVAKPFGATTLLLFVAIGDEPATDPKSARHYGNFTRNQIVVNFDSKHRRKTATYFARWSGQRGDVGPWSIPVSMTIAA
jgi:hypothetical protein